MKFTYTKKVDSTFEMTLDELKFNLADRWFWVVSEVDVSEKIVTKVTSDFGPYRILWVCNPEFAYKYLRKNLENWVFLPCTICVYEDDWSVYVSVWKVDPIISTFIKDESLERLSKEITKTLIEAVDEIK